MMKALVTTVAGIALCVGLLGSPAMANKVVNIINESSHTITSVQATNQGDSDWGENLISQTIPPGYNMDVDLDDGTYNCVLDIRATLRGGNEAVSVINACRESSWTIVDGD